MILYVVPAPPTSPQKTPTFPRFDSKGRVHAGFYFKLILVTWSAK